MCRYGLWTWMCTCMENVISDRIECHSITAYLAMDDSAWGLIKLKGDGAIMGRNTKLRLTRLLYLFAGGERRWFGFWLIGGREIVVGVSLFVWRASVRSDVRRSSDNVCYQWYVIKSIRGRGERRPREHVHLIAVERSRTTSWRRTLCTPNPRLSVSTKLNFFRAYERRSEGLMVLSYQERQANLVCSLNRFNYATCRHPCWPTNTVHADCHPRTSPFLVSVVRVDTPAAIRKALSDTIMLQEETSHSHSVFNTLSLLSNHWSSSAYGPGQHKPGAE